jgi:hypothetical protein
VEPKILCLIILNYLVRYVVASMDDITKYLRSIQRNFSSGLAAEHTHRPALKTLIESFGRGIDATNEPKRVKCGAPDFIVTRGKAPLGYVEAKDMGKSLRAIKADAKKATPRTADGAQLKRYIGSLNNLILTNYLEFRWFYKGEERLTIHIGEETEGIDWQKEIYVLNPKAVSATHRKAILMHFDKLKQRGPLAASSEIERKDRIALDSAILELLGFGSAKYVDRLYKGLVGLVAERLKLPKMRKNQKKLKETASNQQIKEIIESEILQGGVRQFPESFIAASYLRKSTEIPTMGKPLKVGEYFFGKFAIEDEDGKNIYDASGIDEAKFIMYSYKPHELIIGLPTDSKAISLSVRKFESYVSKLREQILSRVIAASNDFKRAELLTAEILSDYGVPALVEEP